MDTATPIPILPAAGSAGVASCKACIASAEGPVCIGTRTDAAAQSPQLQGPTDEVRRLLAAIEADFATDLDPARARNLVRSLRVAPGEVEVLLDVACEGAGAVLVDRAFNTLRNLLTDTDIYVSARD